MGIPFSWTSLLDDILLILLFVNLTVDAYVLNESRRMPLL